MRQHVRAFAVEALRALGLSRRACEIVEVGSYVVAGSEGPGDGRSVREAVLEVCPGSSYTGLDMRPGPGVDLVANLEAPGVALEDKYGRIEVVICLDTFEHVKRPWVAMKTVYDLLRNGGLAIFAVPFAFPIHEHPHDYYRYTQDGLEALLKSYFHDVVTLQDPAGSSTPHTVVAVAKRVFPFTPTEREALLDTGGVWRTNQELLMAMTGAKAVLSFPDTAMRDHALSVIGPLLSGETLWARYERLCGTPSDIHEHLPTLRALAAECDTIVELGTRGAVSTTALLAGLMDADSQRFKDRSLTIVDVEPRAVGMALTLLGHEAEKCHGVDLQGVVADTGSESFLCDWLVARGDGGGPRWACDMLFVDTLHSYAQLKKELRLLEDTSDYDERNERGRSTPMVRKLAVFHDTVTYGLRGEDGEEPGLAKALDEFLLSESGRAWEVEKVYGNNNGLTVLRRKS